MAAQLSLKILCVQNIECETLGTLEKLFRSDGLDIDTVHARNEPIPDSIEQYAGVIILGGPMSVHDKHPYLQKEQKLIKVEMENNVPVLGVCLGSQLIAQAAGGRVYRGIKKEIGWRKVSVTPAGRADIFAGIGGSKDLRVFQWHGDTYDLPSDAVVLAKSDLYPQAFRIGSAVGIQFHLEVNNNMIGLWTEEYAAELKEENIRKDDVLPKAGEIEDLSLKCSHVYHNFSMALQRGLR
ncbi:MAG: type 1 glutamine amidotransferase [Nitrososphaera sp.]